VDKSSSSSSLKSILNSNYSQYDSFSQKSSDSAINLKDKKMNNYIFVNNDTASLCSKKKQKQPYKQKGTIRKIVDYFR
jgi:hypothetical protein